MGLGKKIKSAVGKAMNLDLKAREEGMLNYDVPTEEREKIAFDRAQICYGCDRNEIEPIISERIFDELLPELSNRMCGECFCPLPYLLRQDKKKCKLKKW